MPQPTQSPLGNPHQTSLTCFGREKARSITRSLMTCPYRKSRSSSLLKLESQNPFSWNIPPINFGWTEFPTSRGFQRQLGKISARPRRIELRSHHAARGVNADPYTYPHFASNSVSRLPGNVGQDLMNDPRHKTNGACRWSCLGLGWRMAWTGMGRTLLF